VPNVRAKSAGDATNNEYNRRTDVGRDEQDGMAAYPNQQPSEETAMVCFDQTQS
jgi:hypothetical protein